MTDMTWLFIIGFGVGGLSGVGATVFLWGYMTVRRSRKDIVDDLWLISKV